ncbi:hypothetical protein [Deinococcus petrolearius]|uniref:DUF2247 domain-containing protein n=1 Tax=Deinococcus petrolearius TaxID=1751295 RepID=A0ABW1DLI3_9DEIO
MIPESLRAEAALQHLLLREGFTTSSEIVPWADAWVMRLDDLPDELVDISLSRGRADDILSALNRLAQTVLDAAAFGRLCQLLYLWLEREPQELGSITALLWRVHYDSVDGIRPLTFEPSQGLYMFREYQNLIPDGYVQMTLDELREEVLEFLTGYASPGEA